jgi:hypothetical protein
MTRVIYLDGATALKQSWFKEFFIKWSNRGYDIRLKFGSGATAHKQTPQRLTK